MGRRPMGEPEAINMDMTPMIDVVFQLMIFFILVTEVSQAEIEVLTLPKASEAVPDKNPEAKRLILNVNTQGEIKFRGKKLSTPELAKFLKMEAGLKKDPTNPQLSDRAILIRCDIDAEYKHLQTVMQECAKVGIWKLEIAAAGLSDKEKKDLESGGS